MAHDHITKHMTKTSLSLVRALKTTWSDLYTQQLRLYFLLTGLCLGPWESGDTDPRLVTPP